MAMDAAKAAELQKQLEELSESLPAVATKLASVASLLKSALGGGGATARLGKDKADALLKMYSEIVRYENHYSSVRTGVSTFLTGIGLLYGSYSVVRDSDPFGIVVAFLLFAIALYFNIRFMKLTRACYVMQDAIEVELAGYGLKDLAGGAGLFRNTLATVLGTRDRQGGVPAKVVDGATARIGIKGLDGDATGKPAEWVPDARVKGSPRYWDGNAWTAGVAYLIVVGVLLAYCSFFNAACGCKTDAVLSTNLKEIPTSYRACGSPHGWSVEYP